MLRLSDWNKCMRYAQEKCIAETDIGCVLRAKPYTMYDGRKGIAIQLFDERGEFYTEAYSGICENSDSLIDGVNHAINIIKKNM